MTGTLNDWLLQRVEKIQREKTELKLLIADLKWQTTFMGDEFDWDHFLETVERAKEEHERNE